MSNSDNVLPIEGVGRLVARQDGRLGNVLVADGKISARDIDPILAIQRARGIRFGEAALQLRLITRDDLRDAIARQYGLLHLLPGSGNISRELVAASEPFHPRAEELRALRTQLLIRWANARVRHRMLAIVSPGAGEGRSYVAANLAVVFSQLGQRTILIDADLRKPRQHRIFDVPDRVGLSSVLSGRADHSAVVPLPQFGTLSLLPAGACPPNPQELLLRPVLTTLLDELRNEFDVVLFDTPPASLYADAQSLAFRAGSAIVLARKNHTSIAATATTIRVLSDTGTSVVGTVFNVI
ncbi:MAG TPA: chain length determinant protein tyrosine kinase EpsG [Burkholderiales bacterium]|nr:chain length determinant protein tyrosine kinase EpsG [Burkholderiales bacterium]